METPEKCEKFAYSGGSSVFVIFEQISQFVVFPLLTLNESMLGENCHVFHVQPTTVNEF